LGKPASLHATTVIPRKQCLRWATPQTSTLGSKPYRQGRRQRGGQWCPAPPFEIGSPPFHVWPTGCCIRPILYFKNLSPLLALGSSFWFLALLLLNPGGGLARGTYPSSTFSRIQTCNLLTFCNHIISDRNEKPEPYHPHSIPPNWGAHAVTGGPIFQSRHHLAPQRKLRSPKLKYEVLEISEVKGPFERKVHYSYFGPL